MKNAYGTQEWSVKTVNCITGCSHDCRYCYAKGMAIRFKQVTPEEWPIERVRDHDVAKRHKNYGGQVMFPSSHDITPINVDACLVVLKKLLKSIFWIIIFKNKQIFLLILREVIFMAKKAVKRKTVRKKAAKPVSRKVKKQPSRWHAVPLKGSFMATAILGFFISYYYVCPVSFNFGIAVMLIFAIMFLASVISMTKAPIK